MTERDISALFQPLQCHVFEEELYGWRIYIAGTGREIGPHLIEHDLLGRVRYVRGSTRHTNVLYLDAPKDLGAEIPPSWIKPRRIPKPETIPDCLKAELEEKLAKLGIQSKRKNGGLRLKLYSSPEIYFGEDEITIQTIGGGFHGGSRHYSQLLFNFDIADPNCDIIDRILEAVACYQKLQKLASDIIDRSF